MKIIRCSSIELEQLNDDVFDLIVFSTYFNPQSKLKPIAKVELDSHVPISVSSLENVRFCSNLVNRGGIFAVYGIPYDLPFYATYLENLDDNKLHFVFRHWISLDIDLLPAKETLQPSHQGLLLMVKSAKENMMADGFHLDPSQCKVPHRYCEACGNNIKDWGGKKHLMNPEGSAISDVWSDLPKQLIKDNEIPEEVLKRLLLMFDDSARVLIVKEANTGSSKKAKITAKLNNVLSYRQNLDNLSNENQNIDVDSAKIEFNKVYQEDCVTLMKRISREYPLGVFDLVFADPPYNLVKSYEKYADDKSKIDYIKWCNEWLWLCTQVLKPGGALMILNLPKWTIYHSVFLDQFLEFRHWICWDAMSDPRGKILPAHYSLLYYTKAGAPIKYRYNSITDDSNSDYVNPPDAPIYCLRQSCIKNRKKLGDDKKKDLSDIWSDVHRIKHKRDRDYHPCQLPEKLMDRIIRLTTDPQDKVFDPFGGVGTTALISQRLSRQYITSEIDPLYVQIINEKLQTDQYNLDLFGVPLMKTVARKQKASDYTKKEVETALQRMAKQLGRLPTLEEIQKDAPWIFKASEELYPEGIKRPLKAAKLVLVNKG